MVEDYSAVEENKQYLYRAHIIHIYAYVWKAQNTSIEIHVCICSTYVYDTHTPKWLMVFTFSDRIGGKLGSHKFYSITIFLFRIFLSLSLGAITAVSIYSWVCHQWQAAACKEHPSVCWSRNSRLLGKQKCPNMWPDPEEATLSIRASPESSINRFFLALTRFPALCQGLQKPGPECQTCLYRLGHLYGELTSYLENPDKTQMKPFSQHHALLNVEQKSEAGSH